MQVLHELRAVVADDPAQIDGVRTGCLDPVRLRLVARRLRVPRLGLAVHELEVQALRGDRERRRDTEAVELLVREHVDLLRFQDLVSIKFDLLIELIAFSKLRLNRF